MIKKQGRPSIGYSEAFKCEIVWEHIRNANHARLQVTRQSSLTEIVEHFLRAGRSIVGDQQLFHVPRVTRVGWHGLPRAVQYSPSLASRDQGTYRIRRMNREQPLLALSINGQIFARPV